MTFVAMTLGALMQTGMPPAALIGPIEPVYAPLDRLKVVARDEGASAEIIDSHGKVYGRAAGVELEFTIGGALGRQKVRVRDAANRPVAELGFIVEAKTEIRDENGEWSQMLEMFRRSMWKGMGDWMEGYTFPVSFEGRTYHQLVGWHLDEYFVATGAKWFEPKLRDFVDLHRQGQREDGMIYSMTEADQGPGYWDTAYGPLGFARRKGGRQWVRQPVENHPELFYVLRLDQAWKATGDLEWLKSNLDSAKAALDYVRNDPLRWSNFHSLLRRVYTIDTWDFQADDEFLPRESLNPTMLVDAEKSKFTIFFGDNTGYAHACFRLAEMMRAAGREADAGELEDRGRGVQERIERLSWLGGHFRHTVEEDPAVVRDFGVAPEKIVSLSNAYSLNRTLDLQKRRAILSTYQALRANLPPGGPGEWFFSFPPYERGFGAHSEKWEYMNGGVSATVAGELAKGAFESGMEDYGVDILRRVHALGRADGGRIGWGWRGAPRPAAAPRSLSPIPLAGLATMPLEAPGWMGSDQGNDLSGLPRGTTLLAGIPWEIGAKGAPAAVALQDQEVRIPVGRAVGAAYLLHTVQGLGDQRHPASLDWVYADGSRRRVMLEAGVHLTGWWFPRLAGERAGVAWRGPNGRSLDVGPSWCALDNPRPEAEVAEIVLRGTPNGPTYALLGLTLSDQAHPVPRSNQTYGGPENWPPASMVFGLIEGLAGVHDASSGLRSLVLSPRWSQTDTQQIEVTARYAASDGYVRYRWERSADRIRLEGASSAETAVIRVLLPPGMRVRSASRNGNPVEVETEVVAGSHYGVVRLGDGRLFRLDLQLQAAQ